MKTVYHKSSSRGHANYGWLDTHYTFSFANYYDPGRVHFGSLRVLNDDWIDGGGGFDRHPHDNMEIVTIVQEGVLEHQDSMGHKIQIHPNEIQIMSAGTGVFHSEYNPDPKIPVKLLQIWILPKKKNIKPRYDQKVFDPALRHNQWQRVVSPDEHGTLFINQETYFSLVSLDKSVTKDYLLKSETNGIYVFLLDGVVDINGINLGNRDGLGVWETMSVTVAAQTKSEILVIEVSM